jgi:hypothetical protein
MEATPVSEGVKRIVDYINAHPKCNRRQLIETLAPTPASAPIPVAEPPPPAPAAPAETQPASQASAAPAGTQPPPKSEAAQPTSEQTAVIADLHWLVHQGHVIEFASGVLEAAKKPLPKPPKPEAKPKATEAEAPMEPAAAGEVVGPEAIVSPEPALEAAPEVAPNQGTALEGQPPTPLGEGAPAPAPAIQAETQTPIPAPDTPKTESAPPKALPSQPATEGPE